MSKRQWLIIKFIGWIAVAILLCVLCSCVTPPPTPEVTFPPSPPQADGGLGFIRTLGLIGIGAVTFFACWNSMKIYKAALIGIATTVSLTTTCMYYEKWFALIAFVALGVGLLSVVASLFVKHKGIFLAWRKK